MGTVAIWMNSQSQQAMNTEGERRERIADRKNELLELVDIDSAAGTVTVLNNGTSDSVITYIVVDETYVKRAEFQDPSASRVDIGAFTVVTFTDPSILNNVGMVEIGTDLGNVFLFTAPSAVITVESTFFSYGNKLVILDGTESTDADGYVVLWEWDLDYDGAVFDIDDAGQRISVSFPSSGSYTVALRVTDDSGMTTSVDVDILVP
jgi:PKD repeat protein